VPTLSQKTTTLLIFENKGALYEQYLVQVNRITYSLQKGWISCNINRCLGALSRERKWHFSCQTIRVTETDWPEISYRFVFSVQFEYI